MKGAPIFWKINEMVQISAWESFSKLTVKISSDLEMKGCERERTVGE